MKIVSSLFAVFVLAGLATCAYADPGWSASHQRDPYFRHERMDHHRYAHDAREKREYRDFREFRGYRIGHRRPAAVYVVPPPALHRPVMHVMAPPVPAVSIYFPGVSIEVR